MLGDEKGAADALADAEAAIRLPRFFDGDMHLARAAVHAVAGRSRDAVAAAQAAAAWAAEAGMVFDEAMAWHTVLQLAPGPAPAERLAALAESTDSALVRALATHAAARVAGDADTLMEVSDQLVAMGAWLLGAESAAAASGLYAAAHQDRPARAASNRALALAAECEGARSPLLDRLAAPGKLTRRELEVARLAAEGLASKAIARRLNVSIRTVDTHLYHAYTKLGVSDRVGLTEALQER
jgi:DNA-binding NarL/FixJ family response regulator